MLTTSVSVKSRYLDLISLLLEWLQEWLPEDETITHADYKATGVQAPDIWVVPCTIAVEHKCTYLCTTGDMI